MTLNDKPPSPAELVARRVGQPGRPADPAPVVRHRLVNAIAAERTRLGLSRNAVEKATGVPGLKAIEDGKNVNVRSAVLLARFFGLSVEALWTVPAEVPGD